MSVHRTEEEWTRLHSEYFAEYKATGLSDRDAETLAVTALNLRS